MSRGASVRDAGAAAGRAAGATRAAGGYLGLELGRVSQEGGGEGSVLIKERRQASKRSPCSDSLSHFLDLISFLG